jgi:hypothetical protein
MDWIHLDALADAGLAAELEGEWWRVFRAGEVAYDPGERSTRALEPFWFHYIPGRDRRPNARGDSPLHGLRRAHTPCPFDDNDALRAREVARFGRDGRAYRLITNRYPVARSHFLLVRDAGASPVTLPQCIAGPAEVEDALLLARATGPGLRFYFNSNSGGDRSFSGSTVNHWHFHVFPNPHGPLWDLAQTPATGGGATCGKLAGWDVPHRYYRGFAPVEVARETWDDLQSLLGLDIAYNLELIAAADGSVAAALFPRAPIEDVDIPGVGSLPGRFGGWELSGDVVVYTRAVFDWVGEHGAAAVELAWRRLRSGTRDIWG